MRAYRAEGEEQVRTLQVERHEIERDARGGRKRGINDRDLGVSLAEVSQQRPIRARLAPSRHRFMRHAVPL